MSRYDEPINPRITSNPGICGGKACIRGTRFRVVDVLDYLAGGDSIKTILAEFDFLEREDITAALVFAEANGMTAQAPCSIAALCELVVARLPTIEAAFADGARVVIVE